jgi:hypothetical protein
VSKLLWGWSHWQGYYARLLSWVGNSYFRVVLDVPRAAGDDPDGWSGTSVAENIAAAEKDLIHPDALWDRDNDVVSLLGCSYDGNPD